MQHLFVIPMAAPLAQEPKAPGGGPSERSAGGTNPTTGTQPPAGTAQPGMCASQEMMFFLPVMFLIMWVMVIRPDQKRKKEAAAMMASLKQGEPVVTIGGMHGVVHSLTDREVVLMVDNVRMTFDRSAIARVVRDEPKPAAKKA